MRALLVLILIGLALGATPARAEWLRGESPNFIVFSEESEARVRERLVQLEHFDALLRQLTTVTEPPAPNKLHIYIVDGPAGLRMVRPVGEGTAGFYTASPSGIAALVDRSVASRGPGTRNRDGQEVLFHEYVHHFMWQYRANAYPAWYVEGFAEYFMTTHITDRAIDIGNASADRAAAIMAGNWLPIERVLFGTTAGLNQDQAVQFYAQSWLMVHYFFSTTERQTAIRRYLIEARRGDGAEALQRATGLTTAQLNDELRRYIRGGRINYRRMNLDERQAPAAVSITRMARSADDLLLYQAALRAGIDDDQGPNYLRRIRTAAARHAGDPFAQRVLAHAEALFGDGAVADRLLDPLIAASPNDAELLYIKGMRHLAAAEDGDNWDSESRVARNWFSRAHRADENHYQTLYRYAQTLRGQEAFDSENTSNVLLLSHQLAPQVSEITMNAAMLLIHRRQIAEAEALLQPLAADPHDAGLAAAARQMLQQARGETAATAEPATASH
jgi:hypothetical protein